MKNFSVLFSSILFAGILIFACCPEEKSNTTEVINENSGVNDSLFTANSFVTNSIIYDVEVIADTLDEFRVECLKEFEKTEFVKIIFDAVYSGRLEAFDILTEEKLSIKEIKLIEEKDDYDRSKVGKLQFNESWYLDKETLKFEKKVIWVKFGYEKRNSDGSLRGYMPLFGVWMK